MQLANHWAIEHLRVQVGPGFMPEMVSAPQLAGFLVEVFHNIARKIPGGHYEFKPLSKVHSIWKLLLSHSLSSVHLRASGATPGGAAFASVHNAFHAIHAMTTPRPTETDHAKTDSAAKQRSASCGCALRNGCGFMLAAASEGGDVVDRRDASESGGTTPCVWVACDCGKVKVCSAHAGAKTTKTATFSPDNEPSNAEVLMVRPRTTFPSHSQKSVTRAVWVPGVSDPGARAQAPAGSTLLHVSL